MNSNRMAKIRLKYGKKWKKAVWKTFGKTIRRE
jgi:hypothetical protein